MREQVYNFIKDLDLGTFELSSAQPRQESGVWLYVKNLKTLYVDTAQNDVDTILTTMDGRNIQNQVITVTVYFGCDSKQLPADYVLLVTQMLKVNNITDIATSWQRKATQTTDYENDILITTVQYTFTKLLR